MQLATAYLATAVIFFALDFIWLSSAMGLYRGHLGGLLLEQPNLLIAAVFYLLYVAGIVVLVISPALREGSWWGVLLTGAVLGLVAYGTYDITNLSTVKGWSWQISLIDLAWGTVLTAVASTGGFLVTRWLER
jgi:uncharacterized membrane protein